MSINYAAVHDRKPWRKHRKHGTLHAAIDGNDGAKNLLRRIGRVADMWRKHGDVQCVFVWEDGAEQGVAFRLDPQGGGDIQSEILDVDRIMQFDKSKGCNAQQIAECFSTHISRQTVRPEGATPSETASDPISSGTIYPDELPVGGTYVEGLAQEVLVNRYERSIEARKACIEHYGTVCQVCGLEFGERYGPLGNGFIHVHHRVPIAAIDKEYCVDPIEELVPVCPNCHAMLHRREPPLEIEELTALLQDK